GAGRAGEGRRDRGAGHARGPDRRQGRRVRVPRRPPLRGGAVVVAPLQEGRSRNCWGWHAW
uniref:Uncharacterized protein n=1 Tax=Triticum urartu TaxID=4572 RepID=A0A8R7NYY5_TRIUA